MNKKFLCSTVITGIFISSTLSILPEVSYAIKRGGKSGRNSGRMNKFSSNTNNFKSSVGKGGLGKTRGLRKSKTSSNGSNGSSSIILQNSTGNGSSSGVLQMKYSVKLIFDTSEDTNNLDINNFSSPIRKVNKSKTSTEPQNKLPLKKRPLTNNNDDPIKNKLPLKKRAIVTENQSQSQNPFNNDGNEENPTPLPVRKRILVRYNPESDNNTQPSAYYDPTDKSWNENNFKIFESIIT